VQIEIKIDETCNEPRVVIYTAAMTEAIRDLAKKLSGVYPQAIAGFKDGNLEMVQPDNIVRIYTAYQKVYIQTEQSTYLVRLRLYELEERLDKNTFVRISHSEIINLKKVVNMDLSFRGTICVRLFSGDTSFVSRRYVAVIKQILGI